MRWGVRRLVNISSETVSGFIFAERPFLPGYLPLDEAHPVRPQDPYALAKLFGEQLCDAAVARSELRCISIRPTWVQNADSYERNLVTDCAGNGFDLDLAAPDDTLVDNRALRNGADGIHVGHSGGTTLTRNRAENNTGDGIDVTGGTDGGRNRAKRNGGVQCTGVSCRP